MAGEYIDKSQASGSESPAALLPVSAFGGKTPEVGKVCKFRVVQVYEDQVEVEYVASEDAEPEESLGGEPLPPEEEMTEFLG